MQNFFENAWNSLRKEVLVNHFEQNCVQINNVFKDCTKNSAEKINLKFTDPFKWTFIYRQSPVKNQPAKPQSR